jgi:ubiquinone/menaquinone biosynthesis C-methylase UbiE
MSSAMSSSYALGHSSHEMRRLEEQGDYFRDLTRDLFLRAGVCQGMRVLDYGGGAGDVAILASEIVGPAGAVVSFDRSAEAISRAKLRAADLGLTQIRFLQADENTVGSMLGDELFDAAVGRLVLVFQSDPAEALRTVMRYVRPGGIVAFHEYDQEGRSWSQPHLHLLEKLANWVIETFRSGGMVTDAGRVSRTFRAANVESLRVVREGQVSDGADPLAHKFLVDVMRSILPLAEKRGVTTAAEVQIDTLFDRLQDESDRVDARWIPAFLVAAWGRVSRS